MILVKNGRVIDPASDTDKQIDILIKGSKIVSMSADMQHNIADNVVLKDNLTIIDAADKIVVPGLIDCHVHFREPGFEYKETINSGTKAAAKGGFTSVICEPNTKPPIDTVEIVDRLTQLFCDYAIVNVYTKACMTKGSLGRETTDIELLAKKDRVLAVSDDGNPVIDDKIAEKIFNLSRKANIVATPHCEDSHYSLKCKHNNARFSNPPYTNEPKYISRDIEYAEKFGTRLHISHISLKESVGLIREAKKRNRTMITCEVTPHHLLLSNDFVDSSGIKPEVNPPLRSCEDANALRDALADGTIDVIASDHAPHTQQDKENGALGLIGLDTTIGLIVSGIVGKGILSLNDAIKKMSYNPASIFGINAGKLSIGMPADITIIDPHQVWVVNSKEFGSKSENCPFIDKQLKGKVFATIVNGNIVMKDNVLYCD